MFYLSPQPLSRAGSRPPSHLLAANLSLGLVRGTTHLPGQRGTAPSSLARNSISFTGDRVAEAGPRTCTCPRRPSSPRGRRLLAPLGLPASSSCSDPLREAKSRPRSGCRDRPLLPLGLAGSPANEETSVGPQLTERPQVNVRRAPGTLVGGHRRDRKSPRGHQLRDRKW